VEYNIVINQAALRKWVGKINLKDAAIVGFIRALTPDDPAVRHYMLNGYYRLNAGWILRQVPLLDLSEDWLLRCLKKLKTLGLLDTFSTLGRKKRLNTYGKLSAMYFREEQNARDLLEGAGNRYAEKTPGIGEKSDTRRKLPVSENDPGETPIDHKKDDLDKAVGAAPPGGAASDSLAEETPAHMTEAEFDAALERLPPELVQEYRARRRREAQKEQKELPGIDSPASQN